MLEIKINKVQWDNFIGRFVVNFKNKGRTYNYVVGDAVDEVDAFKKFKQHTDKENDNVIWL
jgi:hypothetical protein